MHNEDIQWLEGLYSECLRVLGENGELQYQISEYLISEGIQDLIDIILKTYEGRPPGSPEELQTYAYAVAEGKFAIELQHNRYPIGNLENSLNYYLDAMEVLRQAQTPRQYGQNQAPPPRTYGQTPVQHVGAISHQTQTSDKVRVTYNYTPTTTENAMNKQDHQSYEPPHVDPVEEKGLKREEKTNSNPLELIDLTDNPITSDIQEDIVSQIMTPELRYTAGLIKETEHSLLPVIDTESITVTLIAINGIETDGGLRSMVSSINKVSGGAHTDKFIKYIDATLTRMLCVVIKYRYGKVDFTLGSLIDNHLELIDWLSRNNMLDDISYILRVQLDSIIAGLYEEILEVSDQKIHYVLGLNQSKYKLMIPWPTQYDENKLTLWSNNFLPGELFDLIDRVYQKMGEHSYMLRIMDATNIHYIVYRKGLEKSSLGTYVIYPMTD